MSERISNVTFDTGAGWTLSTGWTISGGELHYDGLGSSDYFISKTANGASIPFTITGENGFNFYLDLITEIDPSSGIYFDVRKAGEGELSGGGFYIQGTNSTEFTPGETFSSGNYILTLNVGFFGTDYPNLPLSVDNVSVVSILGTAVVSLVDKDQTTINVEWTAVDEATSYDVYLNEALVDNTSDLFYEFTGLLPGTEYSVFVITSGGAPSDPTTSDILYTETDDSIPPVLSLEHKNDTVINVSWTPIVDTPEPYDIYLDGDYYASTSDLFYEFTGLTPNTEYEIFVKGYDIALTYIQSNTLTVTTNSGVPVLSFVDKTDTTISVEWTEVEAAASYKIYVDDVLIDTVTELGFEITGLTPGTEYDIYVIAGPGLGDIESNTLTITTETDEPLVAPILSEEAKTTTTISVSWTAPTGMTGAVTGYEVYLDGELIDTVEELEYDFTGLSDFTEYEIYVIAITDDEEEIQSNTLTITTEAICQVAVEQEQFIPFRFYDDINKQNRYKSHCQNQKVYELITPSNKLLPFFIKRTDDSRFPVSIKIYDLDGVEVEDVTNTLTYELLSDGTYAYFFYYGTIISGMSLDCGFYYLAVEFCATEIYYSEIFSPKPFTTDDAVQPYLLLEWKHSFNIDDLIYQTGYLNRLYVNSFLAEPGYELEEEGDENGDKEFFATFQRGIKKYKLELTPVPEFIIDSLFIMNAHDNKKLFGDNYEIIDFRDATFETKWQDTGCLATGILSFRKYNIIKSRLCGESLELSPVTVPIDCSDYAGFTLAQLAEAGVTLADIANCTLSDFYP